MKEHIAKEPSLPITKEYRVLPYHPEENMRQNILQQKKLRMNLMEKIFEGK